MCMKAMNGNAQKVEVILAKGVNKVFSREARAVYNFSICITLPYQGVHHICSRVIVRGDQTALGSITRHQ